MEIPRSSPARLTALATLKLPRWVLLAICMVYLLPGIFGRDLWKTEDDATGFGIMLTMAHGTFADWIAPNVAGAAVYDSGPLMYWVGAIGIKVSQWLPGDLVDPLYGARVATGVFFLLAAAALWYATYLLGRRPDAQPLALAFGGQPEPRDYGRVLADGALLIWLATLGLITRMHETGADSAVLAMLCVTLYALARAIDQPKGGALWLGFALIGLFLARGPYPALAMLVFSATVIVLCRDWRDARIEFVRFTFPFVAIGLLLWYWAVSRTVGAAYLSPWLDYWTGYGDGSHFNAWRGIVKNLPWLTLPGGPLAAWAIWAWRKQVGQAHIIVPLGFVVATLLLILAATDTAESLTLLPLPGIVMLAAFALPTLKRGAANAIDWFSLLVYSLIALLIWFSWITRMTGIPENYAASMARQVPGSAEDFQLWPFLSALAVTFAWIGLVQWRVRSRPKVLWRSVVLASAGVTLCWALLMTLFLRDINYSRSYRDVAQRLEEATAPAIRATRSCVIADGLGLAQRASFAYFSELHFKGADATEGGTAPACAYVLRQDLLRDPRPDTLPAGEWQLIWEGHRASDRDERFRLYRRVFRPHAPLEPNISGSDGG